MNRSIFVKHKMLFSFLLTLSTMRVQNQLNEIEYSFLISGISGKPITESPNPSPDSFSEK